MKKKEKSVLCLIFLAAILYSGVTYIANGDTILGYYFDRHIWPWIIPFILCIVMPGVIGIINIVCIIKGAGAATIAGILSGIYYLLVICYDLFFALGDIVSSSVVQVQNNAKYIAPFLAACIISVIVSVNTESAQN